MLKLILLCSLFLLCLRAQAGSARSCLKDIARVMEKPKNTGVVPEKVKEVLGRGLKEKEVESLNEAQRMVDSRIYTAAEVLNQDKLLLKNGFTKNEIAKLRKENILKNSFVSTSNGAPIGMETQKISLQRLTSTEIKDLKSGKKLQYVICEDGNLFVNSEMTKLPTDKIILGLEGPAGRETSRIIREAGEITYDKEGFVFRPAYGFDTTSIETEKIGFEMAKLSPGAKVSHPPSHVVPQARAVKCMDILSAQSNGKNFVLDRMIADNAVATGAILVGEASGAGRLNTEQGREVIAADLIGGNITGFLGGKIRRSLAVGQGSLMSSMVIRTGVGLEMIEVQKAVTGGVVQGDNSQKTAEDIAAFNRAHFIARLPVNHAVDQFMVKQLPIMLFNSCMKNPATSVFISPKAVRFYERLGSSVVYYGARQAIIGN